jgi:hypothetical protein
VEATKSEAEPEAKIPEEMADRFLDNLSSGTTTTIPQIAGDLQHPIDPDTNIPHQPQQPRYAFISTQTGISYTRAELDEWQNGKVNKRGDKVYFKPGFVDEDPWARLKNGGRVRSGGVRDGEERKRKGGGGQWN